MKSARPGWIFFINWHTFAFHYLILLLLFIIQRSACSCNCFLRVLTVKVSMFDNQFLYLFFLYQKVFLFYSKPMNCFFRTLPKYVIPSLFHPGSNASSSIPKSSLSFPINLRTKAASHFLIPFKTDARRCLPETVSINPVQTCSCARLFCELQLIRGKVPIRWIVYLLLIKVTSFLRCYLWYGAKKNPIGEYKDK